MNKVELFIKTLTENLEAIKKANGYRTDIKRVTREWLDVGTLTEFPQIGILIPIETVKKDDTNWTILTSTIKVYLFGFVEANTNVKKGNLTPLVQAQEDLSLDMKRVVASLFTSEQANGWIVDENNNPLTVGRSPDLGKNRAMVTLSFGVLIQWQNKDF